MSADLVVKLIIKAINQATAPIREVTKNFESLKNAKKAAEAPFKLAADLNQSAEAVSRFAQGVRGAVTAPLAIAEDFEAQLSFVQAVTRASTKDFTAMRDAAEKIGATTVLSASQAAQGMKGFAQATFKPREIIESMPSVVNLSVVGMTELAEATKVATGVLGGFGLKGANLARESQRVTDVLTGIITSTPTSLVEVGEAMKTAAPNATKYALSLEAAAGWTASLAQAGIKGADAGTAMKMVMQQLGSAVGQGKHALRALGIQTRDSKDNIRDLTAVLGEMAPALAKLPTGRQAEFLRAIFGTEASTAGSLLIDAAGRGTIQSFTQQFQAVAGLSDQLAKIVANNAKGAGDELSSAGEGLAITIGSSVLPTLRELRLWLAEILTSVNDWAKNHKTLVKWLMIGGAVTALLATILAGVIVMMATAATTVGVLAIAMGSSKTGTQILGLALRWLITGGLKRFALTLVTQSIPAAIRFAVTLVRRAAVAVATFAMSLIRQGIPAVARFALALLVRAVPAVIAFLVQMVAMAAGVAGAAVPALVALTLKFVALGVAMLATPIGWIILGIAALIAAVVLIYKNWGPISEWFAKLWEGIKEAFTSAITWISTKLDELLESAKNVGRTVSGFFGGDDSPTVTAPQLGDAQQSLKLGPARELIAGRGMEGELHIKIDSAQPVTVRRMESTGLDLDVDAGPAMVGV